VLAITKYPERPHGVMEDDIMSRKITKCPGRPDIYDAHGKWLLSGMPARPFWQICPNGRICAMQGHK
jgi:hypothetical protein